VFGCCRPFHIRFFGLRDKSKIPLRTSKPSLQSYFRGAHRPWLLFYRHLHRTKHLDIKLRTTTESYHSRRLRSCTCSPVSRLPLYANSALSYSSASRLPSQYPDITFVSAVSRLPSLSNPSHTTRPTLG